MIKICRNAAFEVLPGHIGLSLEVSLCITDDDINIEFINCILVSVAAAAKSG